MRSSPSPCRYLWLDAIIASTKNRHMTNFRVRVTRLGSPSRAICEKIEPGRAARCSSKLNSNSFNLQSNPLSQDLFAGESQSAQSHYERIMSTPCSSTSRPVLSPVFPSPETQVIESSEYLVLKEKLFDAIYPLFCCETSQITMPQLDF